MSVGTDKLKQAFRLWKTDGVPATGAHEPIKGEIQEAADQLAIDIAAAGAGGDPDAVRAIIEPIRDAAIDARDEAEDSAAAAATIVVSLQAVQQSTSASAFTNPGFIQASGVYVASALWAATGFVAVEGGVEYTVIAAATGTAYHAWYDANQAFISYFRGPTGSALQTSTHTSPANARYARISTSDATKPGASFKPTQARMNIGQVKQIAEQHPPAWKATQDAQLAASTALITTLQGQVADLANQLDLTQDRDRPFYVLTKAYTKSHVTVAPAETITILSRDNDTQFTLAAGKGSKLAADGAVVVYDATADRYLSYGIKSIAGDVVTVLGALPATCSSCETMHEANLGQHLGRYGYKGYADYIVSRVQKYAYRKNKRLFTYHPPACTTSGTDPDIYDRANPATKLIDVTTVGGAGSGGFVSGTTDLGRSCGTLVNASGNGPDPLGQIMPWFYRVQDNGVGRGIEMSFEAGGSDGFVQVAVEAARTPYNANAARTEGRVRLEVLSGGVSLHDVIYDPGVVNIVNVDFVRAGAVTLRMTLADNVPTSSRLGYVYAYQKSPETPKAGFFKSGDRVAFLCDSWGVYPLAQTGETPPLRPDGSPGEGMAFVAERLRANLASQGVNITTVNYSKGGMTSVWGLYWVDKIIQSGATHCFVNFAINDANSVGKTETSWDFDPENMWLTKPRTSGGVDGRVASPAVWQANMQAIYERLSAAGVKVIYLLPPDVGGTSQAFVLQRDFLTRLSAGFSTPV